jgi:hypothetical protein
MKTRILLMIAAALLLGIIIWRSNAPRPVALPDGTFVRLTRMKFSDANPFLHGSTLEKALGNLIPTNGLAVGRFHLRRPRRANPYVFIQPTLSVEFQLSGPEVATGRSQVVTPKFNREFRLVIVGEDGFPYVEEFQKAAKYGEGVFIYVNATAFPRRSQVLRFLLQHHDAPTAPWHTVAEFRRRNPVDESDDWPAETALIRRTSGPLEFIAGQVAVETNHSNELQSFWATTVTIPFQLRENGIIQTNWNLHQLWLEDTSGNFLRIGGTTSIEGEWNVFRTFRSLDPRTVWRIRAGLAPRSGFATSNLLTLQITRAPAGTLTTNIGNRAFHLRWVNDRQVTVGMDPGDPDSRLSYAAAWDERGESVGGQAQSAAQFEFWKSLPSMPTGSDPALGSSVTLQVAVTRNVPVEFTIRPRLVESKGTREFDSGDVARTNSP